MQNKVVHSLRSATLLYRQMHTLSRMVPQTAVYRNHMLMQQPMRSFFGGRKEEKKTEEKPKADEKKPKEEKKAKADEKPKKETAAPEEKPKEEKTSSSDEESADELSKEDVKKIKVLFAEQEEEIASMKKELEEASSKLAKGDKEMTLFRVEYTKQVRENEDTVKRYRKMIEDEKQFAISKFAKDLLEVRDAMRFALENTDIEAVIKEEDINVLREKF